MNPTYFLDSSALVKLYVSETGSAWVASLISPLPETRIYLAAVTGAEVVSALARRRKLVGNPVSTPLITAITDFRTDFPQHFRIVKISFDLIESAMDLAERHGLRGYDAIQLAAALEVNGAFLRAGSQCTFVSADAALNLAAIAEGFQIQNPNDHP